MAKGKGMQVALPDREELAKKTLMEMADWDGNFPIPVKWLGGICMKDLHCLQIVHISGDDSCLWVANAVSALVLYYLGHDLETNTQILEKRKSYLMNPEFRQKYPFWYK